MRRFVFASAAAAALLATAGPGLAQAPAAQPTAADAQAFVARAEADLDRSSVFNAHADWVQKTYINEDTNVLRTRIGAEDTDLQVRYAKEAQAFDHVQVDPVTRRKLELMKQTLVLPAPHAPGAGEELADIESKLTTIFATAKVTLDGKDYSINELEDLLRTERDPAKTRRIWEAWREQVKPMAPLYARLVELANQGSRELGYPDTGALWRSWYDMPPDRFAAETDRVYAQVAPLYRNLHCYVRARLNAKYGDAVQPKTGPIRADLVGNMWAQEWGNIYDDVKPQGGSGVGYDLTDALVKHGYDAIGMVRTGEDFYKSLGFAPLPETFWTRSQFTKPRDREVVCHASAWDVDGKDDLRVKLCLHVNADDFYTVHHELGHNFYQRAYNQQPYLFRNGANDGFHEAIGDFAGLNAITPTYLKQKGIIDQVPGPEADIPYLLKIGLDKIAVLPWALLVDKWRWEVFSGQVKPADYEKAWLELRRKYQGVVPPGPRPADAFDPGAKFHIADNTPYTRYFLADIYEFQFYRAACRQAGWKGPLNRCSVYGDKAVGAKFDAMLKLGQSRPWPEALAAFTGEHDIDASAIAEYFAPLNAWLTRQNKGQACGW